LVLLVALASLPMVSRLWASPAMRTSAVGRVPTAVVVDARTQRVFVANMGTNSVSMLDATSGAVLATITVLPRPSALAVATTVGRVFAVSDHVTPPDHIARHLQDRTARRQACCKPRFVQ
jgi:YVTN family beta-propeller protein